jgi:hypothetical protein
MIRVGFEPTTTAFQGAKAVHVLDRAATVIGTLAPALRLKEEWIIIIIIIIIITII